MKCIPVIINLCYILLAFSIIVNLTEGFYSCIGQHSEVKLNCDSYCQKQLVLVLSEVTWQEFRVLITVITFLTN